MLDVLAVFRNQVTSELAKGFTKLGNDLLANKVLDRFFLLRVGICAYFELLMTYVNQNFLMEVDGVWYGEVGGWAVEGHIRHTHSPPYHAQPQE